MSSQKELSSRGTTSSQNTVSNSINDIYYKLGCVIAILSHNNKEIDITQFDVLNKILPAIRMDNIFVCFNKNNHPVAFFIWKKVDLDTPETVVSALTNWHHYLGWKEGEHYLVTHFVSNSECKIDSVKKFMASAFFPGDIISYLGKKGNIKVREVSHVS
ncbi:toxin-activating lysine-acyltransferase [Vibrio sp. vnigr-6D03]|uniref:toxin-activating lysine-acyltransferase n=1 Tax=Vibrio sp. vnigr-6D03 TaxID=2058088 RepID=UPI0015E07C3B|nr:toxin-activating lysine-acyltransferase [Vibrio sp. vnigr-6D03]